VTSQTWKKKNNIRGLRSFTMELKLVPFKLFWNRHNFKCLLLMTVCMMPLCRKKKGPTLVLNRHEILKSINVGCCYFYYWTLYIIRFITCCSFLVIEMAHEWELYGGKIYTVQLHFIRGCLMNCLHIKWDFINIFYISLFQICIKCDCIIHHIVVIALLYCGAIVI
jgi:hypothetical protein